MTFQGKVRVEGFLIALLAFAGLCADHPTNEAEAPSTERSSSNVTFCSQNSAFLRSRSHDDRDSLYESFLATMLRNSSLISELDDVIASSFMLDPEFVGDSLDNVELRKIFKPLLSVNFDEEDLILDFSFKERETDNTMLASANLVRLARFDRFRTCHTLEFALPEDPTTALENTSLRLVFDTRRYQEVPFVERPIHFEINWICPGCLATLELLPSQVVHIDMEVASEDVLSVEVAELETTTHLKDTELCRLMRQIDKVCYAHTTQRQILQGFYPGLCQDVEGFFSNLDMNHCDIELKSRSLDQLKRYAEENAGILRIDFS